MATASCGCVFTSVDKARETHMSYLLLDLLIKLFFEPNNNKFALLML